MGQIYCIRNIVNGKCYVGQTVRTFRVRYRGAKWWEYTDNSILLHAVEKHGIDIFNVSILNTSNDIEELNILEQHWAEVLNSYHPNGYNIRGCGGNKKISESTLETYVYRPVRCSNGKVYKSIKEAAEELKISKSDISNHLNGKLPYVHGFSFSDLDGVPPAFVIKRDASLGRKKVYCSNGKVYENYKTAAKELNIGKNLILRCLKKIQKNAGDLVFSFDHEDDLTLVKTKYETTTRIRLSNGMLFDSLKCASDYLKVTRTAVQYALTNGTTCRKFYVHRCDND